MQMTPPLGQKVKRNQRPLDESEKAGLKLNNQKVKIMASGHITSSRIHGGNNGISERLYSLGLQNHCR